MSGLAWHAETVQRLAAGRRWRKCLGLFTMFALSDDPDDATILTLPLPTKTQHWPLVPEEVLGSSLGLVARLTLALSEALAVGLPHPIFPNTRLAEGRAGVGDAEPPTHVYVLSPSQPDTPRGHHTPRPAASSGPSPASDPPPHAHLSARAASATAAATTTAASKGGARDRGFAATRPSPPAALSGAPAGGAAVGGASTPVEGAAAAAGGAADGHKAPASTVQAGAVAFSMAVALLQNDVVRLCVKAGVPHDALHAEAMLLNLGELRRHCERMIVEHGADMPDLPLPQRKPLQPSAAGSARVPPAPPALQSGGSTEEDWEMVEDEGVAPPAETGPGP